MDNINLTLFKKEINGKEKRLKEYMDRKNYDGLVIYRKDNFSWLTGGGDNHVNISSETGDVAVVITKYKKYIIGYFMDVPRVRDEEVSGQNFEIISILRTNKSIEEAIKEVLPNNGCFAADIQQPGMDFVNKDIYKLHYPLFASEIERYKKIAQYSGKCLTRVAQNIRPGQTEYEVASHLFQEFTKEGFSCGVMLVGSDERIFKYRHPIPTDKKINKYVLLAPAVNYKGLHVLHSRSIHFGQPSSEIRSKFLAASKIHGYMIKQSYPGITFKELFFLQKNLFNKLGFSKEWEKHFQGGLTGYHLVNLDIYDQQKCSLKETQAMGWFITITGVKTEETTIVRTGGGELISFNSGWPSIDIKLEKGSIHMPDIMIL